MPTKTNQSTRWTTRPARHSTGRAGAGRFSRPLSVQSAPRRGKKQPVSGFGALMSSLPATMNKRPTGAGRSNGKAKPAMALLAAAGAVLGRKQMQKRKGGTTPPPPAAV